MTDPVLRSRNFSDFSIGAEEMKRLKSDAILMHPLPRIDEISKKSTRIIEPPTSARPRTVCMSVQPCCCDCSIKRSRSDRGIDTMSERPPLSLFVINPRGLASTRDQ